MSYSFPPDDAIPEPLLAFNEVAFQDAMPVIVESMRRDLAFSIASIKDQREASWYGPWLLALQIMFLPLKSKTVSCITCPQLPVVRNYDPASSSARDPRNAHMGGDTGDDDFSDEEDQEEEEYEDKKEGEIEKDIREGNDPSGSGDNGHNQRTRSDATSRESLAPSPIGRTLEEKEDDPTPLSTPSYTFPIKHSRRSVRIPDFVQLITKYHFNDSKDSLDTAPANVRTKLIMIVEVKPPFTAFNVTLIYAVQRQVTPAMPSTNTLI